MNAALVFGKGLTMEEKMPVILIWAVPAVIVLGGGVYLLSHIH